jgi:chitinase
MIWAIDTDDDKFSAISGLMGHQVSHIDTSKAQALAITDSNVAATLKLENGQGCRVMTDYDCTLFAEMTCPDG